MQEIFAQSVRIEELAESVFADKGFEEILPFR